MYPLTRLHVYFKVTESVECSVSSVFGDSNCAPPILGGGEVAELVRKSVK